MSWFDASTFSKYAKTALKQAQKNIDKVLDINEDEEDASKLTNTQSGGTDAAQLTSSPPATTYVVKESDSFFDSFLGDDIKKQVSNYLTPQTNNRNNINIDYNDVDTSQRKGRLKDRFTQDISATNVSTPDLLRSNDDSSALLCEGDKKARQDISLSSSLSINKGNSSSSLIEIVSNDLYSKSLTSNIDDLFDDIDLSDNDVDTTDNISDISDSNVLFTTAQQNYSPTEENKVELLNEQGVVGSALHVNKLDDVNILDYIKEVNVDSKKTEIYINHASGISSKDIEENDVVKKTANMQCDENISPVDNLGTLTKDKGIVSEVNFETVDDVGRIEASDNSHKTDKLLKNANDYISENNNIGVKTEELIHIINASTPETKDILSDEGITKPVDTLSNDELLYICDDDTQENKSIISVELQCNFTSIKNNDIVVETDSLGIVNDITLGNKDRPSVEFPNTLNQDIDLLENSVSTELKASDCSNNDEEDCNDKPLDSNEIDRNLVNKEGKSNETHSEKLNIDVSTTDSLSKQNELKDVHKDLKSNDSLVHIDRPKRSTLCIVNPSPLEMLMQQTEYELISDTGDMLDADLLQQSIRLLDDSEKRMKWSDECALGNISGNVRVNSDIIMQTVYEINEHQFEEVDQLNEKIAGLNKEVNELRSIIEAREMKMVELSKQNIGFQESLAVYQSQINQLEQMNKNDDEEMEHMRQEFTKRISESDIKCQTALKERNHSKAKLIETEASIRQSSNEQVSVLTNSLYEKEETIRDLLNEGEALSKKELEANMRIKKLRLKLKEVTTKNTTFVEQVSGFETEIEKLNGVIKEKEGNEIRLQDELKKLEGITDSQEDEVSALKEKLDDMEETYKAMESTLHNTYSEINRLNLQTAQKNSEMQEASVAVEVRKDLEQKLKDLEKNSRYGKEELITQLEDLQVDYSRLEQQLSRREDELKKEIEDLHKRLEHGEHRNQELSQSVSAATKPLLRQIGNLQNSYAIQSDSWERVENTLTDRLISIQDQLALAMEKERSATEIAIEAKSKLKAVQTHQTSLKEENKKLHISVENESNKCTEAESERKRERFTFETKLSKLKGVASELQREKKVLEDLLAAEIIKYENDTLRMSAQLSLQQLQSQQQLQQLGNPASRHSSCSASLEGDFDASSQNISMNNFPIQRYLSSSSSYHDGFLKGTTTTTAASIEHLKIQLRSREGEVFVLQEEVKGLEKTKASLAQELVNLANKVEELEIFNEDLEQLKEEYSTLKSRYDAVLQMYGEKAEEADELKMDIEDVKNMYRQQIQELCGAR